jgi:hypothetical protein
MLTFFWLRELTELVDVVHIRREDIFVEFVGIDNWDDDRVDPPQCPRLPVSYCLATPLLYYRPCKDTHVVDGQTGQCNLDFWRNHLSPSPTDIDTLVLALDIIQIQW